MKKITIKENPFAGFEQFALTAEEARMVKGGFATTITAGGDGGGGSDFGGLQLEGGKYNCSYWCPDDITKEGVYPADKQRWFKDVKASSVLEAQSYIDKTMGGENIRCTEV